MFNHAEVGYRCPFCRVLGGEYGPYNSARDIVGRTAGAAAWISPRWWPNNHGHAIVVPVGHYENLYELPDRAGHAVHDLVRRVAVAMRGSYGCDGVSTRQHNEPAGNQDVWHLHVHVFPRYEGDELYGSKPYPEFIPGERRWPYADRLRAALDGLELPESGVVGGGGR
jgi:histidine triad (HIT) family protein